ncbi:Rv3235 family protein [Streptomyces sp. NPDC048441]|uniref:Rv3235 family protein n=1 Tax=Streptomyces sp. NPDC048441 TaxID=3365552 RepID=UPI0037242A72
MHKVMTRPRTRPTTTTTYTSTTTSRPTSTSTTTPTATTTRPPNRRDPRRPTAATRPLRTPPQPPPHPTELFTERLLLVLSGQKPVHWAAPHITHTAFDDLARLAERTPLTVNGRRPTVHRIGHYEPRPGVYEVFARIGTGPTLRALAFRMALGADERWRCTAVEVGTAPDNAAARASTTA